MAADGESHPRLEIAHVLTMDVVEYSSLLITEQSHVMDELARIAKETIRFRRAEAEGKLIRIPTGDGMALVFFHDPEAPIECAMEIASALKNRPEIRLRMGIHSGPVREVLDVNERSNVAGAGIDVAQRVMDCGDAGHILLSKRVAEDLAPYPQWNPHLHDLGECEVKHGRRVSLVNFYTDSVGNPTPPQKCRARAEKQVRAEARVSRKSIAVLPFENLSEDKANDYFAAGIQEEILTRLSKISDLKVISRTSTLRFKSSPENLPQIAKQLGVANILEGSVQKAADHVRVNVQLIEAESDSHLWAERYDRKLTDIFAVESDIATKIADALQAKLTGAEQKAITSRPTENSEAHQAYLRGKYYWYKYPGVGYEESRRYFQQAIEIDPAYSLGYSGLSYYYGFAAAIGMAAPNENWPKAAAAANKALELDDTQPDNYNAIAAVNLYYHRNWPGAERYFRRGIELNPNSAEIHHHYAACLVLFGRNEEAVTGIERAAELDPLAPRNNLDRAKIYFFTQQWDRAIDQFRKTLELYPDLAAAHEWLGYVYETKRMQKEAVAEWGKALTLSGRSEDAALLERAHVESGFDAAVRALAHERLERFNEGRNRGEYVPAAEYVMSYVRLGDTEQAFTWLAKAVEERNRLAFELRINPSLDALRGDPRFHALTEQLVSPSSP